MPRYYFNVFNDEITLDEEGRELVDARSARAHAINEARVLAANSVLHGYFTADDRIEILDQDQTLVALVRFDEAVDIRLPGTSPVARRFPTDF